MFSFFWEAKSAKLTLNEMYFIWDVMVQQDREPAKRRSQANIQNLESAKLNEAKIRQSAPDCLTRCFEIRQHRHTNTWAPIIYSIFLRRWKIFTAGWGWGLRPKSMVVDFKGVSAEIGRERGVFNIMNRAILEMKVGISH